MTTSKQKQKNKDSWVTLKKIMGYLVKNAYTFTAAVMGLVHAMLLVIFIFAGVPPLVYFNLFSVSVYIVCFILCRMGHIMPAYVSIILEVTIYVVVSTYYVGLRCGTYCFLFSIIPIIIYFGSSMFK